MLPHKQSYWGGKEQQAGIASAEILSEYKKNTMRALKYWKRFPREKVNSVLFTNVQDLS